MIRILHITEDHSAQNTGITSAVDALVRQVQPALHPSVLSTGDEAIPLPQGVTGVQLPIKGAARAWRASPGASLTLARQIQEADVIHIHGAWMWVQWAAARTAFKQHKPFLLTLHGMLEPWIGQRQNWLHRLKKKLYWQGMAYPVFRHASLIHAIHAREAQNLNAYFPYLPIDTISPSLDLAEIDRILAEMPPTPSPEPYLLFLGRLHPVKGIDLLIQAFAQLDAPHLRLKIAGPIQAREAGYAEQLHTQVRDAGLEQRVDFLGAMQGHQKWELLRNAWVFCLPSHSEVIGMVNLEAAACRTPVITTLATGLSESWVNSGGMLVAPGVTALAQALAQALRWTEAERTARGERLHALVSSKYSWQATSPRWIELYQLLAGGA